MHQQEAATQAGYALRPNVVGTYPGIIERKGKVRTLNVFRRNRRSLSALEAQDHQDVIHIFSASGFCADLFFGDL